MVKKKKSHLLKILLILTLLFVVFYSVANISESETIGENSLGEVVKHTYSHYSNPTVKIAVISGMHPRENMHKFILPEVSKLFALFNNVEVTNYQVDVKANAQDFTESRNNGESLVHDYVVEDIGKEDYDLVIIGHDHEVGYGSGYYIATPTMDSKSVNLAENLISILFDFNYYKRDTSQVAKSTSISKVDTPIVETNTPVFVYEIPENDFIFPLINSYRLIDASFKVLNA